MRHTERNWPDYIAATREAVQAELASLDRYADALNIRYIRAYDARLREALTAARDHMAGDDRDGTQAVFELAGRALEVTK